MKLILYRNRFLDYFIITLLLLQVFAVQWLNYTFYYSLILDVAILSYLIYNYKRIVNFKWLVASIFVLLIYILLNCMKNSFRLHVLLSNMYPVLTSVLIISIFASFGSDLNKLKSIFISLFPVINIYMILNCMILLLQWMDIVGLAGRHAEEVVNNFKPDLISGLFGFNGTPMLGAFSAFFLIYLLWYYREKITVKYRIVYLVYYFIVLALLLFISIKNDNKGFFVQLAISYVIYFFARQNNYRKAANKMKGFFSGLLLVGIATGTVIFAYKRYEPFAEVVDLAVKKFLIGISSTNNATGGAERFAIINYFIRSRINRSWGVGIGYYYWKQELAFGFRHFGQNDLGPFLLLGGILFVIILVLLVYNAAYLLSKNHFISFGIVCYTLFLLLFTQLFTTTSIMISFMLFVAVAGLTANRDKLGAYRNPKTSP